MSHTCNIDAPETCRHCTADRVCTLLASIRNPAHLYQVTGEVPEEVAAVLAALTEWMGASGMIDAERMETLAPQFRIGEYVYALVRDSDLDKMRAEIFTLCADNLEKEECDPILMQYAAKVVRQLGAYYIERAARDAAPPPT